MSTEIEAPLIYSLIPQVMAEIGAVEKNRKNEQQKYSFRGIEDFYQAAHPAFVKHGVFCVPKVIGHEATSFEKSNDQGRITIWRHVTVTVEHRFYAPDGSHVDVTTMGEGLDNSDKATNKAMSGAMKYALIELFSVPTQDVEDADRTSPETGLPMKNRPPTPVTKEPIKIAGPRIDRAQDSSTLKGHADPVKASEPVGEAVPPQRQPAEDDLGARMVGGEDAVDFEPLANAVMAKLKDVEPTIDLPKQKALHRLWKDSIPPNASAETLRNADTIFREWLKHEGFVGEDGKGSTKRIPEYLFGEVKGKIELYASNLR